jgi:copper(I)-binding protein
MIKGTVVRLLEVTPQPAVLNTVAGSLSNATAVVRIVNNQDQPMTLSEPASDNKAFAAELKTIQPGKEFQLTIKTVPPLAPGNVNGQIAMKTSLTNTPVIEVKTMAVVQPAVTVQPSRILLPVGSSSNTVMHIITIHNNDDKPLTLSEPAINAKGVDVQMKETEPGRHFIFTVTFPPRFEAATNQNIEFSVKSSNPQFPVIKTPFIVMPRPVPPKAQVRPPSPMPPTNAPTPPPSSGGKR